MARTKRSMRCVGIALMALMMVFAMTVGSFAMSEGEYNAHLEGPAGMPHDVNQIIAGPAAVTTDGSTNTVTVPLQAMEFSGVTGHVVDAMSATPGYTADVDGSNLVVTCSSDIDVSDFSVTILFDVERSDDGDHSRMPATLTLS